MPVEGIDDHTAETVVPVMKKLVYDLACLGIVYYDCNGQEIFDALGGNDDLCHEVMLGAAYIAQTCHESDHQILCFVASCSCDHLHYHQMGSSLAPYVEPEGMLSLPGRTLQEQMACYVTKTRDMELNKLRALTTFLQGIQERLMGSSDSSPGSLDPSED